MKRAARTLLLASVACDRVAMPLMVEPLAMKPDESGYGVDGDVQTIETLVRQAVELGADVINRAAQQIATVSPRTTAW